MHDIQIIESARENLNKSLADPRIQSLPETGWRWQTYCIHIRKQISQFQTLQEIIHFAQEPDGNAGYEARMVGQQLADYVSSKEQLYLDQFPNFADFFNTFRDHEISIPETLMHLNGRLVSSPLYNHISHTMQCLSHIKPERVLEIGGGYGAPGRLWMINGIHRPKQYIDVDFPESLFFAECYLRATLPEHDIVYLRDKEDFEKLQSGSDKTIFLCPIASFKDLLQVDINLIVNTGSLQEMPSEYVSFYMQMITASKCRMFYSSNYFAQPLNQLMESMNLGAPLLDASWQAIHKEYGHDEIRSVAELVFVRSSISTTHVEDTKSKIDACLQQGMPKNGSEFLELFDLIRQIDDSDYIISVVNATVERMPSVPKEALLLARRANLPEADIVKRLEQIAQHSLNAMGGVGTLVSHIRDRLVKEGSAAKFSFLTGRLIEHKKGTIVEINNEIKHARSGNCGSVERVHVEHKGIVVSGWAMKSREAASMVHVFYDGCLMWSGTPIIERPEFDMASPVGFEFGIMLNVSSIDAKRLLVLAEFQDGRVGLLANGGRIQIYSKLHENQSNESQHSGLGAIVSKVLNSLNGFFDRR